VHASINKLRELVPPDAALALAVAAAISKAVRLPTLLLSSGAPVDSGRHYQQAFRTSIIKVKLFKERKRWCCFLLSGNETAIMRGRGFWAINS
jgi:hypothetical protein